MCNTLITVSRFISKASTV